MLIQIGYEIGMRRFFVVLLDNMFLHVEDVLKGD